MEQRTESGTNHSAKPRVADSPNHPFVTIRARPEATTSQPITGWKVVRNRHHKTLYYLRLAATIGLFKESFDFEPTG